MTLAVQVVAGTIAFLGIRVLQLSSLVVHQGAAWWTLEAMKWGAVVLAASWGYKELARLRVRLDAIREMALKDLRESDSIEV